MLDLSKSVIKVGYNRIGDKGCEYLAKGEWPSLKDLLLCSYEGMQGRTG